MSNKNLKNAKKAKNDEFYTQLTDIEKELQHYDFSGKSIYCNCDNPHHSNFYKYFKDNFQKLNITHLYCTGYNKDGNGYYAEYNGTEETLKTLNSNGSFDSDECINILKKADVIVTNPPFSLFREYVKLLMDYNKKFLIIGNQNAITYKEIFPYIKNNELWLGCSSFNNGMYFKVPNDYEYADTYKFDRERNGVKVMRVSFICWFTNLPHNYIKESLILTKTYNPENYPQYDNYDAINVDKVKDIPIDYDGVMGVPITFLQYYNPKQFEILWLASGHSKTSMPKDIAQMVNANFNMKSKENTGNGYAILNKHQLYHRILIKKNDSLEPVEFEIKGILATKELTMLNGKPKYARLIIKPIFKLSELTGEVIDEETKTIHKCHPFFNQIIAEQIIQDKIDAMKLKNHKFNNEEEEVLRTMVLCLRKQNDYTAADEIEEQYLFSKSFKPLSYQEILDTYKPLIKPDIKDYIINHIKPIYKLREEKIPEF